MFIVINGSMFEQRSMKDVHTVQASLELEEKIKADNSKQLDLSNDGSLCVIGGGNGKVYFYIVSLS